MASGLNGIGTVEGVGLERQVEEVAADNGGQGRNPLLRKQRSQVGADDGKQSVDDGMQNVGDRRRIEI